MRVKVERRLQRKRLKSFTYIKMENGKVKGNSDRAQYLWTRGENTISGPIFSDSKMKGFITVAIVTRMARTGKNLGMWYSGSRV